MLKVWVRNKCTPLFKNMYVVKRWKFAQEILHMVQKQPSDNEFTIKADCNVVVRLVVAHDAGLFGKANGTG